MKKTIFWPVTFIITFSVGLAASAFFYFWNVAIVATTQPSVVEKQAEQVDCKKSASFPGLSQEISKLKRGKSGYFPMRAFADGWENADPFMNDWYGKHLRAMNEKSLLDVSDENKEIYRFLWLRSFDHPIFVRAERDKYSFSVVSRELNGAGGYEPGKILRTDKASLTREEWCDFMRLLDEAKYWQMPTNQRDDMGNDGAQWILEGVRDNRYHIVDRWSPETGRYREACIFLLNLSGRDVVKLGNDLY